MAATVGDFDGFGGDDVEVRTDNGSAVACWDDDADGGADLTRWLQDRTAKGSKALMSLNNAAARDVQLAEKRGYVAAPVKRERPSGRSGGEWDTSTSAKTTGIPQYDALKDRHCRGILGSAAYNRNTKRMQYAVEASKAQRKFGSNTAGAAYASDQGNNERVDPRCATHAGGGVAGGAAQAHAAPAPGGGRRLNWPLNSSVASKRALASLNQKKSRRDAALDAIYEGGAAEPQPQPQPQQTGGGAHARSASMPPPQGIAGVADALVPAAGPSPQRSDGKHSYPGGSGPPTHRGQLPPPIRSRDLDFAAYDEGRPRARRPPHHKKSQSLPPPKHARGPPRRPPPAADELGHALLGAVEDAAVLAGGTDTAPPTGGVSPTTDGNGNIIIHSHHYHNSKHTTKTYNTHTVNHYTTGEGGGGGGGGSPTRGAYDEAGLLEELLRAEKAKCVQLQERLNDEIQKKVKSNKRAGANTNKVKELQGNVKAMTAEVARLRDRCKASEQKADRFTTAETERRRAALALQEKEGLCRELQELLQRAERRLEDYEGSGAEPRAKAQQLDKEHLRIRLQNEVKTRQQLEKRVASYELELTTLRVAGGGGEGARARAVSEPPPQHARGRRAARGGSRYPSTTPRDARGGKRNAGGGGAADAAELAALKEQLAKMSRELVAAQKARDKALVEITEMRAAFDTCKHDLTQQLKAAQRREDAAQKRLDEKEDVLQKHSQDFMKKAGEVAISKREMAEVRLMVARLESELKAARKEGKKAQDDAQQSEELRRRLVEDKHALERSVSQLQERLEQAGRAKKADLDETEGAFRKRQLAWERDRAELLQQNAKMRIREQELAAEARMHEDAATQLRAQIKRAEEEAKRDALDAHKHEEASKQLVALQTKYASLKRAHDTLKDDRSISQKDAIIEKLTVRLKEADGTVAMLRKTNADLMKRMD